MLHRKEFFIESIAEFKIGALCCLYVGGLESLTDAYFDSLAK